jgi:hypothetical protein
MQLTESEKEIVEKTRKSSARWRKSRWIALPLLVGIVVLAISYICVILQRQLDIFYQGLFPYFPNKLHKQELATYNKAP